VPLPQVPASDLDVAVIAQLPPPQLVLGNPFQLGAVRVITLESYVVTIKSK